MAVGLLVGLEVPQYVVILEDPNQFCRDEYDVILHPRTVCHPDGQLVKDQSILQIGSEMDFAGENTRKSTALVPMGTPKMHLDVFPLPYICVESHRPLTGTVSHDEMAEMKDSVSSPNSVTLSSLLLQMELHIHAYSAKVISMLPHDWPPGSVFYQWAKMLMSMTPALDALIILVFIWRKFKSRTNQMTNNENHMKISALNKKIRDTKEKMRRTQRLLLSSHRYNRKLRARVGELDRTCRKTREERDSLNGMVKERDERIRLEQETFKKAFRQSEKAQQQKLVQLEQDWRAELKWAMEDSREYGRRVNKGVQALQAGLCTVVFKNLRIPA
ncbi:hypothetical protein COCON_G00023920 [Conger conger]|uniref:Uncharacterized protein n=1 Tax=Conger conger TaxID=82655 RepID=A0A9Q1I4Q1_CONCO|nr:hypothetical protein COCON_G00023920 [Conger conger]